MHYLFHELRRATIMLSYDLGVSSEGAFALFGEPPA